MGFETTVLLLTWLAIALLAFVVAGLVRRVHILGSGAQPAHLENSDLGLPPGALAPESDRLGPGPAEHTVLLFLDAGCGSCPEVLAKAGSILAEPARPVAITALFAGEAAEYAAPGVSVLAGEAAAFESYQIPAVPFAVVVGRSGRVLTSQPVGSPGALQELLDAAIPPAVSTAQAVGPEQVKLNGGAS